MPVRDEEKTLILVLQLGPVLKCTVIVTYVHPTSRSHARYNAVFHLPVTHNLLFPLSFDGLCIVTVAVESSQPLPRNCWNRVHDLN